MPADAPQSRKSDIRTITTTAELAEFCELAKAQPYVTLDTEFLRERTYYSKLCLIQAALPPASAKASLLVRTWARRKKGVSARLLVRTS